MSQVNNLDSHVQHHQEQQQEEEVADREEVPTKCVSSTQNFHVKCSVQFIDFEGRTDGESIAKLLAQLRPRRAILVRGSKSSLDSLKDFCSEVCNDLQLGSVLHVMTTFYHANSLKIVLTKRTAS